MAGGIVWQGRGVCGSGGSHNTANYCVSALPVCGAAGDD